ncbi:MAG TPA: ABC transporter ATP-binding protein [Pseudonocardia sp.]|jgi:multiple sugar transport system ATP-binding protein|nr:ABC transporter ATP-binding protein [Pseudonocardia sp.]
MGSLTVSGLRARYGRTEALRGIDLDVADGEFFVILGPSGAGKTTALKSVAGLVDDVEGEVRIAGRPMNGVEPYERNVAMAFESYALYPQKTVEQNLASPLRSGRSGTWSAAEQAERIRQVTTTLGIEHLRARFPRELSNGQRQRTALGRVLVRPADVYLLDEPLSHLDAKLRAAMRAELKQLGEMSSTTTLYVTHDYQEALALGDRVGVLREGRLVQVGTPEQVWHAPSDTFVARMFGQPEMNLFSADLTADPAAVSEGGIAARTGPGGFAVGLPAGLAGLAGGAGSAVRLGIRPRDLDVLTGPEPADRLVLRGRVTLAERLGRLVELSVDVAGVQVIAVTDDQRVREGDRVAMAVDWSRVHVFAASDPEEPGADTARLGAAAPLGAGAGALGGAR